jgi:alpha 1,2-mannosyltransferase
MKRKQAPVSLFTRLASVYRRKKPPREMFCPDGFRRVSITVRRAETVKKHDEWRRFIEELSSPPPMAAGTKGIVICAGGPQLYTCAWVNIRMLRKLGCHLPIEVWHLNHEIPEALQRELEPMGVKCRRVGEMMPFDIQAIASNRFALKPLSILYSQFTQVMLLDADNICTRDPSDLFSLPAFTDHGALFWPDYWRTENTNPIWKVLNVETLDASEQESGQLVIDKARCWRELNLCCHFNRQGSFYYNLLHFDKDTFRFAWLALHTPFSMLPYEAGVCGYNSSDGQLQGMTIVQHDYKGSILFLHRNLLKWDVTRSGERVWRDIRTFERSAVRRRYYLAPDPDNAEPRMRIEGDVITTPFSSVFPELEHQCLEALRELRESRFFNDYLVDCYIRRFRRKRRV